MIRDARLSEAAGVGRLHSEITSGFLPSLGAAFLGRLYRALIAWDGADVLVGEEGGRLTGFVASVDDTGAFYRHFAVRHGVMAGLVALPRLIRPSAIKRAWETLRYGTSEEGDVHAELLAIATATESRGKGWGGRLLAAATDRYRERGLSAVRVVVGADNEASLAAHRKAGFSDRETIELHAGEPSKVLVWSA